MPFAHATYTRSVLDYLNGRGIPPSAVLAHAGLGWQDLAEGRSIDYAAFRRFVAEAGRCSGEPALGLMAGLMLQPYHSAVGIAAVTSDSVERGLHVLYRYSRLLFAGVDFRLDICAHHSTLQMRRLESPLHETHDFFVLFVIGAHCRLMEAMLGKPVDGLTIGLPFPRPLRNELFRLPHVRQVDYAQEHLTLRLPIRITLERCVSANRKEHFDAEQVCRRMALELDSGAFACRVRRMLRESLGTDPDAHQLASRLGISAQTMARRLADVGTTYSDLKEALRQAQASWYLQHTEISMEALAAQLGYAEQASFSRAFKRWFLTTPSAMRQHLRCGVEPAVQGGAARWMPRRPPSPDQNA